MEKQQGLWGNPVMGEVEVKEGTYSPERSFSTTVTEHHLARPSTPLKGSGASGSKLE